MGPGGALPHVANAAKSETPDALPSSGWLKVLEVPVASSRTESVHPKPVEAETKVQKRLLLLHPSITLTRTSQFAESEG